MLVFYNLSEEEKEQVEEEGEEEKSGIVSDFLLGDNIFFSIQLTNSTWYNKTTASSSRINSIFYQMCCIATLSH